MNLPRLRIGAAALRLAAPALLVVAVPACSGQPSPLGDEWVLVQRGRQGRVYMDTSRVAVAGAERIVWLRTVYEAPDTFPDEPGKLFWGVTTQHRLNCAERTVTDLGMTLHDSAGAPMESGPGTRWTTFDEHPFGEYIFPGTCRRLERMDRS